MYEDKPKDKSRTNISEKDRVLAWQKDVAESTAIEAPHPTSRTPHPGSRRVEREPPRVIVNQIITTPAVFVTRARPESTPKEEISTKAVIGTVLGATAGAVIAYGTYVSSPSFVIRAGSCVWSLSSAMCFMLHVNPLKKDSDCGTCDLAMTKSQTEDSHAKQPTRVGQKILEAPVTYELVQREDENYVREQSRANSQPNHHAIVAPPLPRSHVDGLTPVSNQSHPSTRMVIRNHVEGVTSPQYVTKISIADHGKSRASLATLHDKTTRQSDFKPITDTRSAKDVPLPCSPVTSLAKEGREDSKAGKSSVLPKESVSQFSTRRSEESKRSKHSSSHYSGSGKDHEDWGHRSRTSRKRKEQRRII